MPRFPKARWDGPIPNRTAGAMRRPIMGLVLHVEQGSESGTDSWFHNPKAQASAHFGNPLKGKLDQWVDTNDKAWAEVDGNSNWISVEHEGYSGKAPAPTASQVENDAQLLAWLHLTEGVPMRVTNKVSRRGLGWHGMGGAAWGGHLDCPGGRIKDARPAIIKRARQIVAESKPKRLATFRASITRTWLVSTAERAVLTFVTAFVGAVVLPLSISTVKSAASAGVAAVLSFLISAVAAARTGTASLINGVENR